MTSPQYHQVPAQVDLPALEHAVLDFWRDSKVFAKSLEQSEGRPEWVFYEGPPTANGMPGAHHIEARVFKDVFPRFRTMQGYHVGRKAGLGLPRTAGRARGREGAGLQRQEGHRGVRHRRVQRQVP